MSNYVNPSSNISYTNKDFQSIYPELLDLVKKLTYKWDPSISNESDPGVILLKLNAIIADKCNYNIDKNVLECFPESVTQEKNARQLFEQLGYYMHWYQSAVTNVSIKYVDTPNEGVFTLPKFTMVMDSYNSVVYTLLGPVTNGSEFNMVPDEVEFHTNGTILDMTAIQGVAVTYTVNGVTTITSDYLDSKNRIYFDSLNIAENGIFIKNIDATSYDNNQDYKLDWEKKDNLMVEELGHKYYSFGVDIENGYCYIEFPEDAEQQIMNGIEITYIQTDGYTGSVSAGVLDTFYNNITLIPTEDSSINDNITLDSENTQIMNVISSTKGKDPESIDEAYRNYKRTIGTFNTLVTIRDYINYILQHNEELGVSNGFVCDRGNDIQSSYYIMSQRDGIDTIIDKIDTYISYKIQCSNNGLTITVSNPTICGQFIFIYDESSTSWKLDGTSVTLGDYGISITSGTPQDNDTIFFYVTEEDKIDAFTFKFYLLQYRYPLNDVISYLQTFNQLSQSATEEVFNSEIMSVRSVQHNCGDILETNINRSNICYIVDKAPFSCRITTQYSLSFSQAKEVSNNIMKAIFNNFDASSVDFGNEIDFDNLLNVVLNSDSRIKNASIDNLDYIPYAVVLESGQYKQYNLTVLSNTKSKQIVTEIYAKSILAGVTPFIIQDEEFDYKFNQQVTTAPTPTGKIDNIKTLETDLDITLGPNSNTYQLRNNENIQLYAPNLLDITQYGNYVKFDYHLEGTTIINANSVYELKSNEYIVFYWKTDDSIYSLYEYAAYGEGFIISPTMQLSYVGSNKINYPDGEMVNSTTFENTHFISSEQNGQIPQTVNDQVVNLTDINYILSSSKTVTIKKKNIVTISSNYYCYWVLNDIYTENGLTYYRLFNEESVSNNEEREYTLKSGEYFFYSNENMTDLVSLGAGTTISIKNTSGTTRNIEWKVRTIDLSVILDSGVSSLLNVWSTVPEKTEVKTTENKFVTLGYGTTFKAEKSGEWTLEITSSGVSNLTGFTFSYALPDNPDVFIPINISVDNTDLELKTIFNINTSNDTEQVLYTGQKVKLTDTSSESQPRYTINGSDPLDNNSDCPVVIMSSIPVENNGSNLINLGYFDGYNSDLQYPSFYVYKRVKQGSNGIAYNNDIVTITFSTTGSKQLSFQLPQGKYIMPFRNSVDGLSITFILDDGETYEQTLSTINNISSPLPEGYLYYIMDVNDSGSHTLTATLSSMPTGMSSVTITILNPLKYHYPNDIPSGISDSDIIEMIKSLDNENQFNWLYQVPEDEQILNPVKGSEFFNKYHIFNKYTIPQLIIPDENSIQIVGKKQ